jgi:hypothetical protein
LRRRIGRIPAKLDQSRFIRMQSQPELCQTLLQICQKRPRRCLLLEAHHTIIGVTKHDDLSSPWLFPPVLNPEIEGVVQIDVRQQRRKHGLNAKDNFEFERTVGYRKRHGEG